MTPGFDPAVRARQVWDWARDCDFRGTDPYDGLNSRLLAPLLPRSRVLRLAVIQAVKRSPVNLRPLLRVPPGRNPKGLALFLSGLSRMPDLPDAANLRDRLVDALLTTASDTHGAPAFGGGREDSPGLDEKIAAETAPSDAPVGWGYHFPWQARAFLQRAYDPTVVATSFALDALGDAGAASYPRICRRAAAFVLQCLHRHQDDDGVCFSYSSTDTTRVYNASLFGAKILARAVPHMDAALAEECRSLALAAGDWVLSRQRADGAWIYGEADHWQWVDNLHTGFNLESLDFVERALDPGRWGDGIAAGLDYYRRTMIEPDGTARYYDTSREPLDAHTFAQTALTLTLLRDRIRTDGVGPEEVLARADDQLWDPGRRGYHFQKAGPFTSRVIHLRWSQAWMFRALATVAAERSP